MPIGLALAAGDVNGWLPSPDVSGQCQSVHRTPGHINVGKDATYFVPSSSTIALARNGLASWLSASEILKGFPSSQRTVRPTTEEPRGALAKVPPGDTRSWTRSRFSGFQRIGTH